MAWRSAHAWAGKPHRCLACGAAVLPAHVDPLWLRSACLSLSQANPRCLIVTSSPLAAARQCPFIADAADLSALARLGPAPVAVDCPHLYHREAVLTFATEADARATLQAYEADYYLCGTNVSFLLPGLADPSTLCLWRVPGAVPAARVQRDFACLALLAGEGCVPDVALTPIDAEYNIAQISFPNPNAAAGAFLQYHHQLDEAAEAVDCGVCEALGFPCTVQASLVGNRKLTVRGISAGSTTRDVAELFQQLGHGPEEVRRHPHIPGVMTVMFRDRQVALAAHHTFCQAVERARSLQPAALPL
eukprot:EG_transcript_10652